MVPRVGVGAITFGAGNWTTYDYWRYLGNVDYTATTRSISRFYAAKTACTPSISGFDTAGVAGARGSALLILQVFAVFGPTRKLSVLAVFRTASIV